MADAIIRNHLLVVPDAAARGLVVPCVGRLTDHLRTCGKHFVSLENAEVLPFAGGAKQDGGRALVALNRIVWAHEYAALTGDEHQRRHYVAEDEAAVRLHFAEPYGLTTEGYMVRTWLALPSRFGVVREPRPAAASARAERHAEEMSKLSYVVVNRDALSAVSFLD
ncbi:MAG TPA: hypothetical protein VEI02_17235 [Planctomycetota bacterium]|nr:hypothetical protein [Planctomycetota bacterium]